MDETVSRAEADAAIDLMVENAKKRGIDVKIDRQLLDVKSERLHVQARAFVQRPIDHLEFTIEVPE